MLNKIIVFPFRVIGVVMDVVTVLGIVALLLFAALVIATVFLVGAFFVSFCFGVSWINGFFIKMLVPDEVASIMEKYKNIVARRTKEKMTTEEISVRNGLGDLSDLR